MKLAHYVYLWMFLLASYKMYEFYAGRVALETCVGATLLTLVVFIFVSRNLVRAFTWFFENFFN